MVLSLCIDTIKGTFCSLGFRSEAFPLDWSERERTDASVCGHGGIKAREDIRRISSAGFFLCAC